MVKNITSSYYIVIKQFFSIKTFTSAASVASDKVVENVNVNASTSGEEQTEGSVAKHSIVESYVKMIVCRKTTVKLVNVSTGEVLQTSCMTVCFNPSNHP